MKKDKFIQAKLFALADSVKLPEGIIHDARYVMEEGLYPRFKRGDYVMNKVRRYAMAAAAIFVIVCITMLVRAITADSYSLTDLTSKAITLAEANEYAGEDIITLDTETQTANITAYIDEEGETAVIGQEYLIVTPHGTDKVMLYADLNGGLENYEKYEDYNLFKYGGHKVYSRAYQANGEYFTEAYFKYEGVDYYMILESPEEGQAEWYYEIFFEISGQNG